jgi:hypothetical protein
MAHIGVVVCEATDPTLIGISRRRRIAPRAGTALALGARMHALDFEGELACDRPTIPVPAPRESGVRLKVSRVAYAAATVDVVLCDLTRDPRSESFVETAPHRAGLGLARCGVVVDLFQNERPPSTSIVRALK